VLLLKRFLLGLQTKSNIRQVLTFMPQTLANRSKAAFLRDLHDLFGSRQTRTGTCMCALACQGIPGRYILTTSYTGVEYTIYIIRIVIVIVVGIVV
jgi:hypothetical protein